MTVTTKTIDVTDLPFVANRDGKALPKAKKGEPRRCFWNVKSTGDPFDDERIGQAYALAYLEYEQADHAGFTLLPTIVEAMPRPLSGIEVSFLWFIGVAARAGVGNARALGAHYDRVRVTKGIGKAAA